jgi:hypothetical protein
MFKKAKGAGKTLAYLGGPEHACEGEGMDGSLPDAL